VVVVDNENNNNNNKKKERRKSIFREYDELESEYDKLENILENKRLHNDLVNKAILMNLKGEV
jgi:hypothetical protein